MKIPLYVIVAALASCTPSAVKTAETDAKIAAPILIGAACQLASDQGAAEPGWEVWTCALLDAATKMPLPDKVITLKVQKGVGVVTKPQ